MLPGQSYQKCSLLLHDQKQKPPGRVRPGPGSLLQWVPQRIPENTHQPHIKKGHCLSYDMEYRKWNTFVSHTWISVPGVSSLVSMTNLDPYQKANAKHKKMMPHRYPWKPPMIAPFLTPQLWASSRFLSYLHKIQISKSSQTIEEQVSTCCKAEQVLVFLKNGELPLSFFFLTTKRCHRSDGWQDLVSHCPCLCVGLELPSRQLCHSLLQQELQKHKARQKSYLNCAPYCTVYSFNIFYSKIKQRLHTIHSWNRTIAISPAPSPISGLTAMTTKVNFHPPMNPTMKPNTNVEILWMKKAIWSAMALLIMLISLQWNRDGLLCVKHCPSCALIAAPCADKGPQLTLISSCSVHQQSCNRTIQSPFALLSWNTSFLFSELVLQPLTSRRQSTVGKHYFFELILCANSLDDIIRVLK